VLDARGHPIRVSLPLPASTLLVGAWRVAVGRVPLYLLDTDLPENRPEDREITQTLYPSDPERRLQQEIVLGMGGEHLLHALGLAPSVFHLNEGHAAFVCVARIARLLSEEGLTFPEAREVVRASTVFTTHTPVPAGHDRFEEDLIRRHFSHAPPLVGLPWDRFMALGCPEGDDHFNMTYLALRFASYVNGVSAMHGRVSRRLLRAAWPSLLENEIPVEAVSNGIHLPTWTAPAMARALGALERPVRAADFRDAAPTLSNEALWAVRCQARSELLGAVRRSVEARMREHHESPARIDRMLSGLEDHALLLGFARRFVAYKRADLLFRDPQRLARLLNDPERPLRIFIAGKGHPADGIAADVLRRVVQAAQSEPLLGRVFVLDNYEMDLALRLVRGADVWLNTPVRGLEASGTSGMKAAANGGLNLSVLDGWWLEGYDGRNGWTIGDHASSSEPAIQDEIDALHLYHLLEDEIVPEFFDRGAEGLPERWLERVRASLASIPPAFDSDRMLGEYLALAYVDRARRQGELRRDRFAGARERARRHQRLSREFRTLRIDGVEVSPLAELRVGDTLAAAVAVELGQLAPGDVVVELVVGERADGGLANPVSVRLEPEAEPVNGRLIFRGRQVLQRSGALAYGVRARAADPDHALHEFTLWA
jgi:starch phosphorylase